MNVEFTHPTQGESKGAQPAPSNQLVASMHSARLMPIAAPSTVTAVPTKRELMFTQAAEQKASQVGLGRAITRLRERAGLSQAELAKRSNLSGATLGEIERGDVEARWGSLRGVAKGLELGLDSLLRLGIELAPGNAGNRLRQTEREARDLDVERVAREGDGQEG